jgi:hypothetical protein
VASRLHLSALILSALFKKKNIERGSLPTPSSKSFVSSATLLLRCLRLGRPAESFFFILCFYFRLNSNCPKKRTQKLGNEIFCSSISSHAFISFFVIISSSKIIHQRSKRASLKTHEATGQRKNAMPVYDFDIFHVFLLLFNCNDM